MSVLKELNEEALRILEELINRNPTPRAVWT